MPERWHEPVLAMVERVSRRVVREYLRDRAVGEWGTVIDPDAGGDVLVRLDGQGSDVRASLAPSVSTLADLDRVIVHQTPDRGYVVTAVVSS